MNDDDIRTYLLKHNIDWIFNPSGASTMGRSWKHQICKVRKVLASLLQENLDYLDDETIQMLFCKIGAIVKSRPLMTVSDEDLDPLTLNHALGIETGVIITPSRNIPTRPYLHEEILEMSAIPG